MMKYTIEDKNKEWIEKNGKDYKDKNNSNKGKLKFGQKNNRQRLLRRHLTSSQSQ